MAGGIYCSTDNVRSLTGFSTKDVNDADVTLFRSFADADIERYTHQVWTGQRVDEYLGDGDSVCGTFTTGLKPVYTALKSGIIAEAGSYVTVTVDGSTIDSSEYTLVGEKGQIAFVADSIPSDGEEVRCTYYYSMDGVQEAAVMLACSYCYMKLGKSADKVLEFQGRAYQILREMGSAPTLVKTGHIQ
jgi:hypothetical protein